MSYQSQEQKKCNFCQTKLSKLTRNAEDTKWLAFNLDGTLHSYAQCKAIQKNKSAPPPKPVPEGQATLPTLKQENTFVDQQQPQHQQITPYSTYIKISDAIKYIKDLEKKVDELTSIVDGVAQQLTLVVKKVGYPAPEPAVQSEAMQKLIEKKETISHPLEKKSEPDRVIDGTPKFNDISQRFTCNICNGTFHNGFELAGTLFCDSCRTNFEATQEAAKYAEEEDTGDIL